MNTNIFKNPDWQKVILDAGREGRHLTYFLDVLGLHWDEHSRLLETSKKYASTVKDYEKLCEEFWFNMAYSSMVSNNGAGFNTRLWTVIMKNKFSERWNEGQKVDLTSGGSKIEQVNPIQIEIVKTLKEDK